MMEAVQTSETLVNLSHSTRRYNPKDSHLLVANLEKGKTLKKFKTRVV
jgi:hypothetical protein